MNVNHADFDILVRRLERESAIAPRRYRARVVLLALLGYAYIGAVLAVLLGAVVGCIWLMIRMRSGNAALAKVAFALLALAWVIGRSLWVRFEPPAGRQLRRDEAPSLFAEAEEIRRAVQAPRADVVLLTDDYNAAVSQVPRLGIFGFPRNYLLIGLPLLATLPPGHVRAVLAHEFAHLSRAHGRFGGWVYRVQQTWHQLMTHFDENPGWFAVVFRRFFSWYAPYFAAYTFVLRREHEYEADRLAARVVGAREMAQTLLDLRVRGTFLAQRFWPELWQDADASEAPPADVFSRMAATARAPLPAADLGTWVSAAFKQRTDTDDSHPAIRDRVAALMDGAVGGTPLAATPAFTTTAADHHLGRMHAALSSELGARWQREAADSWTGQRAARAHAREGLAALTAKAAVEPLDPDERWQLADWMEDIHGAEAALPLFDALLRDEPEHVSALFSSGRIMLRRGDEGGIARLERVMERDEGAVMPGCGLIYDFLIAEGRVEDANRYRERGSARAGLLQAADRERSEITTKDRYVPATLAPEAVEAIVAQLDRFPHAGRAWLARKVLAHFADEAPLHVLVVTARNRWYWSDTKKQLAQAQEIAGALELPPEMNVFALSPMQGEILKPIRKTPGSLIYDATKRREERRAVTSAPADPGSPPDAAYPTTV